MKDNKILKIAYISFIIMILIFSSVGISYATQKQDLENEQKELDQKIKETSSEIAGVKSEMSQALSQINKLNTQISTYENEIAELEERIKVLETQIIEKEALVKEKEEEYNQKRDLLSVRILAMYESGTTSYLDVLFNSEGLSDFLSKYYIIDQLVEADQELLRSIESAKKALEEEKTSLEANKTEAQNSRETVQAKSNALTVSVNEKNNLVNNLTEEEKELEKKLQEMEEDKKEIQAELNRLIKDSGSGGYATITAPSAAGYISPLAGKTKKNITTGYRGYVGHTGVDFACPGGTPIYAVKDGTVMISEAKKNPNGTYRSYGEYIIIDHHDGTMTLYAHGSPGTRKVKKGDKVSQGQQIMSVGTTGNSSGNHLHFEVKVINSSGKISTVNPTPYLP